MSRNGDVDAVKETRKGSRKGWLISVNIVNLSAVGMNSGEKIFVKVYCQNHYFQLKEALVIAHCNFSSLSNVFFAAAVSLKRTNEAALQSGKGHIIEVLNTFLRNATNCGRGKSKGARNYDYARMAELRCAV